MAWTIYCHIHIDSGRRYVGLTSRTWQRRWAQHVVQSRHSGEGWSYFANAIRKYGKDAFDHQILQICDTLEAANTAEQEWIEKLGTRDPMKGFNIQRGGSCAPPKDPVSARERTSSFMKSKWGDPEYRSSMIERMNSPEFRAKISATSIGRRLSDGTRSNLSRINAGKVFPPHVREKISSALKGHPISESTRAKISSSMKGRVTPPETRAKIATSNTGRFHTPEARARMSAIQKQKAFERALKKAV